MRGQKSSALLQQRREFLAQEHQVTLRRTATVATKPFDLCFDRQLAVRDDTSRFKLLLCGRRAGKTDFIIKDFASTLLENPGCEALFIGMTLERARNTLWRPFEKLNRAHSWGFKFDASKHVVNHPNGSALFVRGAETLRDLEKPRGQGFLKAWIDECGSHRPNYLRYLIEEALEATLMDYESAELGLAGTPTRQAFGYFHDAATGAIPGYSVHTWTAQDNPHVKWQAFVHGTPGRPGLLERRGWDEQNPIFQREYLARWAVDSVDRVYRFELARNVVRELPPLYPGDSWRYILAGDFGVGDACAAAVLAHPRRYGRDCYVVETWSARGLAPSTAAERFKATWDAYKPDVFVGDVGGLGKGYQAEWNKRFPGIPMLAAKKEDKRAALEVVSDMLFTAQQHGEWRHRRGLMSFTGNVELHKQWATLLWDEERKDVAEGQDDDVSHAALYGARECPAFANPTMPDWPDVIDPEMSPWEREIQRRKQDPGLGGAFSTRANLRF